MTRYWLTPPALYERLNAEFHFNFDPCPYPKPEDYDSLVLPWEKSNYVNPPFRPRDGVNGKGPTAFVHKAIAEHKLGRGSVLVLPVQSYVMLLAAVPGIQIRSLGRVKWEDVDTREPMKGPSPICAFVLPGAKP